MSQFINPEVAKLEAQKASLHKGMPGALTSVADFLSGGQASQQGDAAIQSQIDALKNSNFLKALISQHAVGPHLNGPVNTPK